MTVFIIMCLIIIMITSLYSIVYDDHSRDSPIETKDQNLSEIIWLWVSMITIISLCIILIFVHIYVIKIPSKCVLMVLLIFSIINTSITWDYFSRNNERSEKDVSIICFVILLGLFLKEIDCC